MMSNFEKIFNSVLSVVGIISWILPDIDFKLKVFITIFLAVTSVVIYFFRNRSRNSIEEKLLVQKTDADSQEYYKRVFKILDECDSNLYENIKNKKLSIQGNIQISHEQSWVKSGNSHKIAVKGGNIYVRTNVPLEYAEEKIKEFYQKYKETN